MFTNHGAVAYHFVARARFPHEPYRSRGLCRAHWRWLQKKFPRSMAVMLMPNHLHLILPATSAGPEGDLRRLRRFYGDSALWEAVPEGRAIADLGKLRTQMRYVHLNPCRKKLCGDPLNWEWTTHRDYVGAAGGVSQSERGVLLKKLGFGTGWEGRVRFHQYVSGDPSVHTQGTPPPRLPRKAAVVDLVALERAAALALRADPVALRRKGRQRAWLMGFLVAECAVPLRLVARHFGVSPAAVARACRAKGTFKSKADGESILLTAADERFLYPASLDP